MSLISAGSISLDSTFKGAQVWDFQSHGFSLFLYNKASMGRRFWDCHKKFEIVSFSSWFRSFFPRNFGLVHVEPALKKFTLDRPCAKVNLNPMPESTLPPVKNFGFVFWLPCPSFSPFRLTGKRSAVKTYKLFMFFIYQHTVDSFWIPKNDIFCTSIYCTILCVHCGVNCTIISTHRVICHLQRRSNTEAEFMDEIQPKVLRVFLLVLFTVTSTALLEISISSNHATSYIFWKGERRKNW